MQSFRHVLNDERMLEEDKLLTCFHGYPPPPKTNITINKKKITILNRSCIFNCLFFPLSSQFSRVYLTKRCGYHDFKPKPNDAGGNLEQNSGRFSGSVNSELTKDLQTQRKEEEEEGWDTRTRKDSFSCTQKSSKRQCQ